MVAKETRDVDAALDLVSYLTGYDMSLAVAQSQYTVPGRKSTEKEPYLEDPLLRPFYELLQYGWVVPQHPQYGKIRLKLVEVIRDAMQQRCSVKEALADAAATPTPCWPRRPLGAPEQGARPLWKCLRTTPRCPGAKTGLRSRAAADGSNRRRGGVSMADERASGTTRRRALAGAVGPSVAPARGRGRLWGPETRLGMSRCR